jgi:acyl-coenzyme A thioesterase PaaI-like protein
MPLFSLETMSNKDLAYFKAIPWCLNIINNPAYLIIETASREPKPSTEDKLIGATLKTNNTIAACLSMYKKPQPSDSRIEELCSLLALESGLNGHANIVHGGIIATILDEMMGVLQSVNNDWGQDIAVSEGRKQERLSEFTAQLKVKYVKPVRTPGVVCVQTRFDKHEGRKVWLKGEIKDDKGNVLATAESLFIQVEGHRANKTRL